MATAKPIGSWVITPHAATEMARRAIDLATVERVLANPEQRLTLRIGRVVLQNRIVFDGQMFIVRVFVDIDRSPAAVVTAYRSSKIEKYWKTDDEGDLR